MLGRLASLIRTPENPTPVTHSAHGWVRIPRSPLAASVSVCGDKVSRSNRHDKAVWNSMIIATCVSHSF